MPEVVGAPATPAAPVVVPEIPQFVKDTRPLPEAPAAPVATDEQKPEESAAPAQPEATKPDTETPEKPEKPGKSRFERRIDRITREKGQALARAEAAERRNQELEQKFQPQQSTAGAPRVEDFTDVQQYAEAHAEWKIQQTRSQEQRQQQTQSAKQSQQQMESAWESKLDRADRKYSDWDEVVGELKINSAWSAAIALADNGEDVAYHLGSNVKEAQRIVALPPLLQAIEIGKLSATLAAKPPAPKKPSAAPAPITPVAGSSTGSDMTIKDGMSFDDFKKVRNRQLGRSP